MILFYIWTKKRKKKEKSFYILNLQKGQDMRRSR